MTKFSKIQNLFWLALVALLATSVHAQRVPGSWTDSPDSRTPRTLHVQRKVDELFESGEFDRAYFIYRNELAPLGDKYAQYMVGFMHLTGMGIEEDPVVASAWYRLAAERGTPEFVNVRNQLMRDLQAEDRPLSDRVYLQLRREFSDLVILLAAIKRDLSALEPSTGSRLSGGDSSPLVVIDLRTSGGYGSSVNYHGRIRRQLQGRLETLSELGDFPDLETDPDRVDFDKVERLVRERIESNLD